MYVSSECPAGEVALRHRFFSALGAHICNKYQIVLSAGLSKRVFWLISQVDRAQTAMIFMAHAER